MANEINFLEYKKRKENNNIIIDNVLQDEIIDVESNIDFIKYEKNLEWLVRNIKTKKAFKPINNEQISFFKWLLSITNEYCNNNYIDLNLFDENNYFYTLINLKYKDTYFSIKTFYYHNATEVEVLPFNEKTDTINDVVDLDWIKYDKKPPNYEKMKNSFVEEDIRNLCSLYEVDIDYLKNIINRIELDD